MIQDSICVEQPCGGVLQLRRSELSAHKAILTDDSISLLEVAAAICTDAHTQRTIRIAINNLTQVRELDEQHGTSR